MRIMTHINSFNNNNNKLNMIKTILLVLLTISFLSCKDEKPNLSDQQVNKIDSSQSKSIDTIKKSIDSNSVKDSIPMEAVKEITFKEFANDYLRNVKSSKKYFTENSEGSIVKDGYDFVKGYIEHSKVKSYGKSSLRLSYEGEYEADLKFRKNKNGVWKAYMLDTFGE